MPTWAGVLYLAIVLDGLEPARDRRPNMSRVSHQADLARRVTLKSLDGGAYRDRPAAEATSQGAIPTRLTLWNQTAALLERPELGPKYVTW